MWANFGFYLLLLCFLLSIYGTAASLWSAKNRQLKLLRSAKMSATATAFLCFLAAFLMWHLFYQRDYSVGYVFKNSSNDLPFRYTVSAFWSALEGSHFLWTLLISIYGCIAHWTYKKDNEHIMPYVSAVLQSVNAWMFYLAISYSDPFVQLFPAPDNGQGMNALLQNPYMVFHPPSLFTGYTALTIPFAYAVAALAFGDITTGWLRTVRRWSLFAWCFLTVGIFLGGRWAYVVLGWSGYWAWDPVENSSLLPWLFTTALLHSLIVQDKIGHLKRLSLILACLGFYFSFFGTFITRSGIISSVHSFAQSPIGPNYLMFLATVLCIILALYAFRAPSILPSNSSRVWGLSKESSLVLSQFLVISFAVIVLMGTMYPIISEALTGARFHVQAPYFNTFAPYIGAGIMIAIALGSLVTYGGHRFTGNLSYLLKTVVLSIPPSLWFITYGNIMASSGFHFWAQIIGVYLAFWVIACLLFEAKNKASASKTSFLIFISRNCSYVGALIAHIAVVIGILGFLGNYRGIEETVTFHEGKQKIAFYGYEFAFNNVIIANKENALTVTAPITVTSLSHSSNTWTIEPARIKYPTASELFHEVGLYTTLWHDIYLVLTDFDQKTLKQATIEIHINPTVRLVWLCGLLLLLGGIISLCDRFRGRYSKDTLFS